MGLFVLTQGDDKLSKLKAAQQNLELSLKVLGPNYLVSDFALTYIKEVIQDLEKESALNQE